jgi:hypothetical protein
MRWICCETYTRLDTYEVDLPLDLYYTGYLRGGFAVRLILDWILTRWICCETYTTLDTYELDLLRDLYYTGYLRGGFAARLILH